MIWNINCNSKYICVFRIKLKKLWTNNLGSTRIDQGYAKTSLFIVNESSTPMLFNVHWQNGCDNVDQEHEELSGHDTFIKHENDKHKKVVDIRVSYSA